MKPVVIHTDLSSQEPTSRADPQIAKEPASEGSPIGGADHRPLEGTAGADDQDR
ncbi:hypothetical protein [Actinomadura rupiterrae]|uniref:hypothetical protein n=1 Tax=Actinomadura rupiterrae TaxID=559627 RepID=UPI0020A36DC5|nr:hypothetical protein [Actinomadura rupiterrae]MCP2335364.1 hypothetical protein [Actinomadura rupiterrae]